MNVRDGQSFTNHMNSTTLITQHALIFTAAGLPSQQVAGHNLPTNNNSNKMHSCTWPFCADPINPSVRPQCLEWFPVSEKQQCDCFYLWLFWLIRVASAEEHSLFLLKVRIRSKEPEVGANLWNKGFRYNQAADLKSHDICKTWCATSHHRWVLRSHGLEQSASRLCWSVLSSKMWGCMWDHEFGDNIPRQICLALW